MFHVTKTKLLDKSNPKSITLLAGIIIFMATNAIFSSDMYVPSLPAISHYFQVSSQLVQWSITVYLFGLGVAQLIYGPLSDRFGRRNMILVGLFIGLVGCLVAFTATHISMLLAGRLLQGIGMAAPLGLARSIFTDLFTGKRLAKFTSYFSLVLGLAPAIAPLFGGYLQHYFGWRSIFAFLMIYGALAMLVCFFLMPETNKHLNRHALKLKTVFTNYRNIASNKVFLANVLSSSMAISGIIVYYTISPFLLQSVLGVSPVTYGWLAVVITTSMLVGRFLNVPLLKHFSMHALVLLGNIIMLSGGLLMLLFASLGIVSVPVIIIPMMLYILGSGLIFSNAAAAALSIFRHIGGSAAAMYGFIQVAGMFTTSALAANVSHNSQFMMAALLSVMAMISSQFFYWNVIYQPKLKITECSQLSPR